MTRKSKSKSKRKQGKKKAAGRKRPDREALIGRFLSAGKTSATTTLDPAEKTLDPAEKTSGTTTLDLLTEDGISLPRPQELADAEVHEKLWEAIHGLAARRIYLQSTNHLSDRQLYEKLWEKILLDEEEPAPTEPGAFQIADFVGSGGPEERLAYARYYATEEELQGWSPDDLPGDLDEMPAHEDPPFDRDDRLPQLELRPADPASPEDEPGEAATEEVN
ncbi:MAG: hypothetical protein GY856_36155 [bacterium]|nr:hypothetical protein [bacterium]